jgi:hypothetical protein
MLLPDSQCLIMTSYASYLRNALKERIEVSDARDAQSMCDILKGFCRMNYITSFKFASLNYE